MTFVLDTGAPLALLEPDDPDHERYVAMVERLGEDLVVFASVLVELDDWLRKLDELTVWRTFDEDLAKGAYRLVQLDGPDMARAAELEARYAPTSVSWTRA